MEPRVQMRGNLLHHSHHLKPVEIPLPVIPLWSSPKNESVCSCAPPPEHGETCTAPPSPSKLSQKFSYTSRGPKPFGRKCPCLHRETPSKLSNSVVSPMWLSIACCLCEWVLERLLHLREVVRSIQHGEGGVVELFLGLEQYVIEHMKYARVAGPLEVAARALRPSVGRHSRNAATKTAVRASTTVCRRQG